MTPVSSATLALQILQRTDTAKSNTPSKGSADDLTVAASGTITKGPAATASAQTGDALFSVNSPNLNKMKIDLIKRVGDEFGIDESDYNSPSAYGAAIKQKIAQIKLQPNGQQVLDGIGRKLGLDKLGLSIDEVVNAIMDPKGDDAQKLDAALEKQIGSHNRSQSHGSFGIKSDEIGIYTPV
ncbi:hypothetical protein [Hyphomicrobium sp. 2TAF46]|uniref:hypothetical protein n=1 Tax=Hyphomicrobium sp. 2TAF46 TaxID=3233019 RepID=UPI003F8EFC84